MSKFCYQGKTYEVPSVEYRDTDIVAEVMTCPAVFGCGPLLKNQNCIGVKCCNCIFSHYNSEARLEYLKMKGIVKNGK